MKLITTDDLRKWDCCHRPGDAMWDDVIEPYFRHGRTPLEVANARRFSVRDRIWVLLRIDVLGVAGIDSVMLEIVDHMVRKHCLHCGIPYVEAWARGWLSGEDRSVESAAESAARFAWYAARSAYSAAWSARSAYSAACSARYVAESTAESTRSAWFAWSAARSATLSARSAGSVEGKRQLKIIRKHLKKMEGD